MSVMELIKPSYYDEFHCIASACRDSCCIGWEIDIDRESLERYKQVDGPLGERLRRAVTEDGCFRLTGEEERCPFLNGEGLCDLILELGEASLCEICREHPRYYEWYGSLRKEAGIGLCCEAAARLILKGGSLERTALETPEPGDEVDGELFSLLDGARDRMLAVLAEERLSLEEKEREICRMAEETQRAVDEGWRWDDMEAVPAARAEVPRPELSWTERLCRELLTVLSRLEPMDPAWPGQLAAMEGRLPELLAAVPEFLSRHPQREREYANLLSYFLFRHFLKAAFDGEALPRALAALAGVQVVCLWDVFLWLTKGSFSFEDGVESARRYSKELEYCEENLEALERWCGERWNGRYETN